MPTGPGSSSVSPSISPRCSPACPWSPAIPARIARSARCWRWRKRARSARSLPFPASPIPPSRSASSPAIRSSRAVRDHAAGQAHPAVEPDLILVPLIAIDGRGTRLGRGKGHYDRALVRLKKSKARLIGVGWPLQRLTETIPADEWDVPLDALRLARRDRDLQALTGARPSAPSSPAPQRDAAHRCRTRR